MAALTVVTSDRNNGEALPFASAAGGGDTFTNTGKEVLLVKNAGAGSVTVTVAHQKNIDPGEANLAVPDLTMTVPNDSVIKTLGPFPTDQYNNASGLAEVSYSGVTGLTVQVLKVANV